MWILTSLQPGGETHYLLSGNEYVVGRKNCDIILHNDQSISRAHAQLTATDQTLTLKDTSKYGTVVNSQPLTAPVNLKSGDNVTFGVFQSKFSVFHQNPAVCSSCLDNTGKATLSQTLAALGGKLVNTWTQECTHLAMPTVKVTVKTISALLCCRPIVKPEFFSELKNALQQKKPPPKAESFLPEIDEPSLNKEEVNLGMIPDRKQLFSGKTFIFLSAKQLKRLSAAVSFGGGRSQLLQEGSLPRDLLESPHSCVVDVATGSSQTLLPPSSTEWANSAKSILQRKGFRVITESEIGLAAIYASCDKYCNPSSLITDSDSAPRVEPRLPGASLSQSVTVDETVLPAASQNITAYAVNTETSQRMEVSEATGVVAVGETPEKKLKQNTSRPHRSEPTAQTKTSQFLVAETMSSSLDTVNNRDSQRKKPDFKVSVSGGDNAYVRPQPPAPKTNGGTKTFFNKYSPKKPKTSAQASPQKQSTLTNFFCPVNKKRPLEDELSAVMSEPKRPAPESSIILQASNTLSTPRKMPALSPGGPPAVSQTPLESPADLFVRQSEALAEEPGSRKRKGMEEDIQIDDLESIMLEDMDCFDDKVSSNQGQEEQLIAHSLPKQKQGLRAVDASSSSKRQRIHQESNGRSNKVPQQGLGKESSFLKNLSEQSDPHTVSIKTEPPHPTDFMTTNQESRKPPEMSSASTSKDVRHFEDDEASFVEDVELLEIDISLPREEEKAPIKPVVVKQEAQESKIDEDLPKKLVLVEFRSLTVSAPLNAKPKQMQENRHVKNFKCFRKKGVPGTEGRPHIIGGSDLLVHNRGKNSDLDEWLKDAVEEERQNRRDETMGDDLFRYNPTKLSKRR
ncbi:nibrin [Leuresthes tenuis]|uniref:nibrin n=1 Tax=Leuresthes tenuis TaxID=355514 RepID=UPI003B502220